MGCLGLTSTFYSVNLLLENNWAKVKRKDPDLKDQNPYRQRFDPESLNAKQRLLLCFLFWIRIFSFIFVKNFLLLSKLQNSKLASGLHFSFIHYF
jgi:hypothetical protein